MFLCIGKQWLAASLSTSSFLKVREKSAGWVSWSAMPIHLLYDRKSTSCWFDTYSYLYQGSITWSLCGSLSQNMNVLEIVLQHMKTSIPTYENHCSFSNLFFFPTKIFKTNASTKWLQIASGQLFHFCTTNLTFIMHRVLVGEDLRPITTSSNQSRDCLRNHATIKPG